MRIRTSNYRLARFIYKLLFKIPRTFDEVYGYNYKNKQIDKYYLITNEHQKHE